jgi:hypothetical protein
VLVAVALGVAGLLAPDQLGPTTWRGLTVTDLVPGAFLVIAGAATGWRHDEDRAWTPRRRVRRAAVLVACGLLVAAARAGGDVGGLVPEELLRLAVATGIAASAVRWLPGWVLGPATVGLLLAPATLAGGGVLGRGLRALDLEAGWRTETLLGLPTDGVPAVSLAGAVGLVLVGHAGGTWIRRRPPGPASGVAVLTVGVWCAVGAVIVAQLRAPVPALLDLPVALGATALACLLVGLGHLAVQLTGGAPLLVAVGRTAIVPTTVGAGVLGAVTLGWALPLTTLPALPAVTAGVVAAATVAAGCRRWEAWRGPLTA